MRPFFGYYGSKLRAAAYIGPPRGSPVIEPFAGAAGYSTFFAPPKVRLFDKSEAICAIWDFLIDCSEADIRRLPDRLRSTEEWLELPLGPRALVFYSTAYGRATLGRTLPEWYTRWAATGEVTGPLKSHRQIGSRKPSKWDNTMRIWGAKHKARLIAQKPLLKGWSIERKSYREIDLEEAHWHIDPPYQSKAGRVYEHHRIDYEDLADWIRGLPGAVDVCETAEADWLPFEPLFKAKTLNQTKEITEAIYRQNPAPSLFDLID